MISAGGEFYTLWTMDNEVQARAPVGPTSQKDFLRIFLIEKNLLAFMLRNNYLTTSADEFACRSLPDILPQTLFSSKKYSDLKGGEPVQHTS